MNKNLNEYAGYCSNETHIEKKGSGISINTFSYKGCWNCPYFELDEEFYAYVEDFAKIHNVTINTIRRWCRTNKLNAIKCIKERYGNGLDYGSNQRWLIIKEEKKMKVKCSKCEAVVNIAEDNDFMAIFGHLKVGEYLDSTCALCEERCALEVVE